MRAASSSSAGDARDGSGDIACLSPLRNEIVGDGYVNTSSLSARSAAEQHGNSALMLGAKAVHDRPDLVAIIDIGIPDVELDFSNSLQRALLPPPAPGSLQQLADSALELLVLLEHCLDALREMFGGDLQES